MKWFSALPFVATALVLGACERHPIAELPPEGATAFGEHAWPAKAEKPEHAEAKPAAEAGAPAKHETAAPVAEGKPGEAPKFFPESK